MRSAISRKRSLILSATFSLLSTLISTSVPSLANAATVQPLSYDIKQHFLSTRALGMGNAFTAVADDYAAMFYNPAGLARLEAFQVNMEIRGMIDKDVMGFSKDIEDAAKSEDPDQINAVLSENYGKHFSLRAPTVGFYWVWPRWGLAIIPADVSIDLEPQAAGPSIQIEGNQDTTVALSYARSPKWFRKHKISLGATLKGIYRANYTQSLVAADLLLDPEVVNLDNAAEGLTVDGDIGTLFTPDTSAGFWRFARKVRPTFGLTVRNVADYGFSQDLNVYTKTKGDQPPKLQRRLDLGTMLELPDWWVFKSRFAFDIRDIGHNQWTFKKGLHAGAEFNWKLFGWWQGGWRAGINQGYLTAGFTGKLGFFMLDLATYGEEVGTSETKQENRRYMVKASLDF